jgi:hypothetical protein
LYGARQRAQAAACAGTARWHGTGTRYAYSGPRAQALYGA